MFNEDGSTQYEYIIKSIKTTRYSRVIVFI